jgi:ATP-binding cassette subfamily G (WHITE) protein 2 (SNQ2)
MIAFFIGFLAAYLIITEFKSKIAETRSVVTFKRGAKRVRTSAPKPNDIETGVTTAENSVEDLREDDEKAKKVLRATEKALSTIENAADTFSWEGLNYTVPVNGGAKRKLLNDISGYVVPGKLTALMGESGAGKVCRLSTVHPEPN